MSSMGLCHHLRVVHGSAKVGGSDDPQELLSAFLLKSMRAAFGCPAVSSILGHLLQRLARHIHAQVPGVAQGCNPMKVELRRTRGGRRRMYMQAFKTEVSSGMIKKRKVVTSRGVARSECISGALVRGWQAREDLEQLVCLRRWAGDCSGSWGIAEDAAKLGKPAQEVKIFVVMHNSGCEGCWVLNQVGNSLFSQALQTGLKKGLTTKLILAFFNIVFLDTFVKNWVCNSVGLIWWLGPGCDD